MKTHRHLSFAVALAMSTPVFAADSAISFHFTNDAVLQHLAQGKPPVEAQTAAAAAWFEQCAAGGEFAQLAGNFAPSAAMTADERKLQAAKFDNAKFERIAREAWTKANAALPQDSMRVCVDLTARDDAFTRDRMDGIMAVTAGKGRIILKIHPDADWASSLPYTLAHEMHHSYWAQQHFDADKAFTLAEYLVFEGRADYFAGSLFAHRAPWTKALDAAGHAAAWEILSKKLDATDPATLMGAMFGSPQAGIPMWAGYSVGYKLVSDRMGRSPKLDYAAMTAAAAGEFMPEAKTTKNKQ